MLDRERLDHLRHAANVVGMRVGGDGGVQFSYAQLLQVADKAFCALRCARVDQYGLPA